ncbi:hypothetical protein D3C85_1494880 [compost metagenome]
MFESISPETVAWYFHTVTGSAGRQGPGLLAAAFSGRDKALATQLTLTVEQVDTLLIGTGLPSRNPTDAQRVIATWLQVQAAVTNGSPAHRRGLGQGAEHKCHE